MDDATPSRRRVAIILAGLAVLALGAFVLVQVLGDDDDPESRSPATSSTTATVLSTTTSAPSSTVAPTPTTVLGSGTTSPRATPTTTPEPDPPDQASPPTTDAEWMEACAQLRELLNYTDDPDLRAAGVELGCL